MLIKTSLLNQAELLGSNIYQASTNQLIIEIPRNNKKLRLEEQKSDTWLLISHENPEISLKTKEAIKFLKKLNELRDSKSVIPSRQRYKPESIILA